MKIRKTSRYKAEEVILLFMGMIISINMLTLDNLYLSYSYSLVLTFLAIGFSDVIRAVRMKPENRGEFRRYAILAVLFFAGAVIFFFTDFFMSIRVWYMIYGLSILISRIMLFVRGIINRSVRQILRNIVFIMLSVILMIYTFTPNDADLVNGLVLLAILMSGQMFIRLFGISMSQIRFDILKDIIAKSMAAEVMAGLLILMICFSIVLLNVEDSMPAFMDAMWYCFAVVTTIGFGDVVASSVVGRILTVTLGIYGIIVVALITSIIINFYSETKDIKLLDFNRDDDTPPEETPDGNADESSGSEVPALTDEQRKLLREELRARRAARAAKREKVTAAKKRIKVRTKTDQE